MIVARSAATRAERRPASVSSLTGDPSAARLSSGLAAAVSPLAAPSISQICCTAGSLPSTSAMASICAGVSAISARAPESVRIHSTCSAEDVS